MQVHENLEDISPEEMLMLEAEPFDQITPLLEPIGSEIGSDGEVEKLRKELQETKEENERLKKELNESKEEIQKIVGEKEILENKLKDMDDRLKDLGDHSSKAKEVEEAQVEKKDGKEKKEKKRNLKRKCKEDNEGKKKDGDEGWNKFSQENRCTTWDQIVKSQ
ncbi:hypothetical protein FRX31_016619 [Thalictrum thalictroides]|uniref:Uncharacterized protein n=1 Tax=Thalictrum thalictroides TaxID=46969 RepID=A0A7J6W8R9_THATH|nr:hypothetical protein FRX31_016619 [Thalictrum thalictroides]